MSFVMHIPYWIFILILLVIIVGLIWATIKGFHQFCAEHLLYPVTEGLILCVLLIICRSITEFKILVDLEPIFLSLTIIALATLIITVFILALPKIRQDRTLMIFIITCGVLLILIICYIVLSIKFPNLFSHR